MTEDERDDLKRKLNVYERQRVKLEASVRQYENLIEELQAQHEQNPNDNDIFRELQEAIHKRQVKIIEHGKTMRIISGLEWLI